MSYLWYSLVGLIITMVLGLLVSWMTGGNKYKNVDKKLYTPLIHRFLTDTVIYQVIKMRVIQKNDVLLVLFLQNGKEMKAMNGNENHS